LECQIRETQSMIRQLEWIRLNRNERAQ
jgi:hypothetical protein